jgi:hypothetical protein
MQYSQFYEVLKELKSKFTKYFRFFFFVFSVLLLYRVAHLEWAQFNLLLQWFNDPEAQYIWTLVLCLVPLNWALESIKWYRLYQFGFRIPFSFMQAYLSTLAGLSYSLVLPIGIGEYLARLQKGVNHWSVLGLLSISRAAQLLVTCISGGLALIYLTYVHYWYMMSMLIFALMLLILGLYFFTEQVLQYFKKWMLNDMLSKILNPWRGNQLLKVEMLMWSMFRYGVFTLQFYLLLKLVGYEGTWTLALFNIVIIFLVKSLIPSFLDLGPRELMATIMFAGEFSHHAVFASLILWLVNIMLPGIIGLIGVYKNFKQIQS